MTNIKIKIINKIIIISQYYSKSTPFLISIATLLLVLGLQVGILFIVIAILGIISSMVLKCWSSLLINFCVFIINYYYLII